MYEMNYNVQLFFGNFHEEDGVCGEIFSLHMLDFDVCF